MNNLQTSQPETWHLKPETLPWQSELSEHLGSLRLRDRSVALARQHIALFAAWYEAQFNTPFDPRQITGYALGAYRHHSLNEARVAARTWNSRWWALNILCQWGGCPSAMDGIQQKQTTGRSEIHRRLKDDEYHRLHETLERRILAAVTLFEHRDRIRDRAAVLLMLEAGLRVDEVAQLDKTDIRLAERSGIILVRDGKGGKERKVPANLTLRKALTAWLDQRQDENPALFDGKATDRLSTRSIQRIIEDLRADTRIPDLRCHSLRFDFAKRTEKRLIKQAFGRSEIIRIIMDLLGHADSATTEDYLVSSMDELMSAVEE
jgi:integrase